METLGLFQQRVSWWRVLSIDMLLTSSNSCLQEPRIWIIFFFDEFRSRLQSVSRVKHQECFGWNCSTLLQIFDDVIFWTSFLSISCRDFTKDNFLTTKIEPEVLEIDVNLSVFFQYYPTFSTFLHYWTLRCSSCASWTCTTFTCIQVGTRFAGFGRMWNRSRVSC